ncbi:hypothetical protein NDU88_002489 [Pleurodeles waltl]|uniref:Uncharacterized protein n=1 Tax=Pleurodeles waltl TaxID=8319 RepID=A0AAV7MMT2_PLEWA|nr:hypothetical protein NDU88_002489 [Pleurodeles waltl]
MENADSSNLALEFAQTLERSATGPLHTVKAQMETQIQPAESMSLIDTIGSAGSATSTDKMQLGHKSDKEGFPKSTDILIEPNGTKDRSNGNPATEESLITQEQDEETGKTEGNGKNTDWSKEGGDTFYSLTEDSEANSSGCTQSEEEDNISFDLETSLSSATGPTVKQQQTWISS